MKSETQMNQELRNEQDQFESMSGDSSADEGSLKEVEANLTKNYTMLPLDFPEPDPKTLKLFEMCYQNNILLSNLKQEISRLQKLKQQSLYLEQQPPKIQLETSVSQFFVGCQQKYQKRQMELQKLKKDIKTIDSEQVKILMAKNQNIFNLAETYFEDCKDVIDVRPYQDGLVMLTEQRKKGRKKKEHHLEEELGKMSVRSASNDSSCHSKISGIRSKKDEKVKSKYLVRFVNYCEILSELGDEKSILKEKIHYIVALSPGQIPISLAYSQQLNLVLILLKSGTILAFVLGENESQNLANDHHSSHKTEHLYPRLIEISQARIQIDSKLNIIFCQIRQNKLFVLSSDSLLRIYEIVFNQKRHFEKFKICNIIYCQVQQKEVGSIIGMSFSKMNPDELLYITDRNNLCKINISKIKAQILYTYGERLVDVNSFYLETSDKLFFSTENFDPIETRLIEKSKLFECLSNKKQNEEEKVLKICCLEKKQKVYIIRIEKHGFLRGVQMNLESMNPQVQIIETSIE